MVQGFAGLAADVEGDDDGRPPLVFLHGLTFDRTMWRPALDELGKVDPRRRIASFDLPGHGESNRQNSYDLESVITAVHRAVEDARLDAPVMVGHSLGGIIVSAYAAQYPARGVVNVDQPLLVAPFAELLQSVQERLRGPNFADVWSMFASSFGTELLPPEAQEIVRATSRPRQDLVLGYWKEVIESPIASLTAKLESGLAQLREENLRYVVVAGSELDRAYKQWLQEELPQVRVVIFANSGHFPHLAYPAQFASLLADTATW
jgi:pimeloyl-ACP methyl ester carboxylesterase